MRVDGPSDNFAALVRHGVIGSEDIELFQFADSPSAALQLLQAGLALGLDESTPAFAYSGAPLRAGG
jgi:hypothetical protein